MTEQPIPRLKGPVLMPTLNEMARVSYNGRHYRDEGTPAERAWLAYTAMHEAATQAGAEPLDHDGEAGLRYHGNLVTQLRRLWPAIAWEDAEDSQRGTLISEVSQYLRYSHNAVCVERGNMRRPSVWWVRASWADRTPVKPGPRRETRRSEARLTPAEAGEDRLPAQVVTSYRCPDCGETFASSYGLNGHRKAHQRRPASPPAQPPAASGSAGDLSKTVEEMVALVTRADEWRRRAQDAEAKLARLRDLLDARADRD